jgi:hypothetical protein
VFFKIPSQFWFTCYNPIEKSANISKTTREEIVTSRKTPQKNPQSFSHFEFSFSQITKFSQKTKRYNGADLLQLMPFQRL